MPEFCRWKPAPVPPLERVCPDCGHSTFVHIGTEHCPVCELVFQATPEWRRMQERIHGR